MSISSEIRILHYKFQFINSPDAKVFFLARSRPAEKEFFGGSITDCVILDAHLNPSVTRLDQKRKVYDCRLVGADSPEEEDHDRNFERDLIAKLQFESD